MRRFYFAAAALILSACASAPSQKSSDDANTVDASGRSMQELFSGRFPGVEVFKAPGGGISIRIRGQSTFLGSSEPLYIIDGARVQSGAGGLLFLDPEDISKIEVLKDIGSTSIYGSDGANGVILITTKRR
ncbi:MAG: TonB-dependent receptor plug domain-containing protein [Gemmatimonadaceae bacterium]